MLTGENMRFRPASFILFVSVRLFLKFYEKDNIQKLKASLSDCEITISVE